MDVPSRPIHFVTRISIPGSAPAVEINLPFFAFPTPHTEITGWFTTRVTSVCPPMTWTLAFSQAASTCFIIRQRSCSQTDVGKSMVRSTPTGSAPALARSFIVIWIASVPISFAVPVIGSVDITRISSGSSCIAAQSSPTPAPKSTSGLFVWICLNTDRFSTFSGTFPTFISLPSCDGLSIPVRHCCYFL